MLTVIQTIRFPEYQSWLGAALSSAAIKLTQMVGDNYVFTYSAKVSFGRAACNYYSFYEAAEQVGFSRLYGHIHFMPEIENGKEEGRKTGNLLCQN